MMRTRVSLAVGSLFVVLTSAFFVPSGVQRASSGPLGNDVLAHALDVELGRVVPGPHEMHLSSAVGQAALDASGELERRADTALAARVVRQAEARSRAKTQGCQRKLGTNVRVTQDCSLRRQAGEMIAINPLNAKNLLVALTDSRLGFSRCGVGWSLDGGKTWGDQLVPFSQFQLLDGHTADACANTTVAFDAAANAYVAGVLFDVTSPANAILVAKSNAGLGGTLFHTPAASSFQTLRVTPPGVVANDNAANVFHDKPWLTVDANPSSPKLGNVYVTWTRFQTGTGAGIGSKSPIFFSQSLDGGATWSPRIEISGTNPAACTTGSGSVSPNACDQDQSSYPVVGPDGRIYVSFTNANTAGAATHRLQSMIVTCPPAADCGNPASWTFPDRIADLVETQPSGGNLTTGCPSGRPCLPPNGYRVLSTSSTSLSVDEQGRLYFAWADFRNGGGTCTGSAATATAPCDNDVFYAVSTNGGITWSAPIDVTAMSTFGASAQWQPVSAVTRDGAVLWIAYYDRFYGNCESEGCNDITLAKIKLPASSAPAATYKRLTSSSMPNLVVANNPLEAGFLGDYMGLALDPKGRPSVVWADTRGFDGTVEEDVFFAKGSKP